MFEVLIEEVFSLGHDLLAHENVELSTLKSGLIAIAEVVFHNFDDRLLLVSILLKFVQNRGQCGRCCARDCRDAVLAELKEHWEEL